MLAPEHILVSKSATNESEELGGDGVACTNEGGDNSMNSQDSISHYAMRCRRPALGWP